MVGGKKGLMIAVASVLVVTAGLVGVVLREGRQPGAAPAPVALARTNLPVADAPPPESPDSLPTLTPLPEDQPVYDSPPPDLEEPPAPLESILLRARLIAGKGAEVRLGVGTITPEGRARFVAMRDAAGRAGRPPRLTDFATFAQWITIAPGSDGSPNGLIGPLEVPGAPVYRLVAWQEDFTTFHGDIVPPERGMKEGAAFDAGDFAPTPATGARLSFTNAPPGGLELRLERRPEALSPNPAETFLPIMEVMNPDLAASLTDSAPIVVPEGEPGAALVPLPPDPAIRVFFRDAGGRVGRPQLIKLTPGGIIDSTIDLASVFTDTTGTAVTLAGRLVYQGSEIAVPGARILRTGEPSETKEGGAEGVFRFTGLEPGALVRFDVSVPPPTEGRPMTALNHSFEVIPPLEMAGSTMEVVWQVRAYRWISLPLSGEQREQLAALATSRRQRRPSFLVERRLSDGVWEVVGSEHFEDKEREGVSASVTEPGTYRFRVVSSPLYHFTSRPVSVGAPGDVQVTEVGDLTVTAKERTLQVVDHEGKPLPGVRVWVAGENPAVEPLQRNTDAQGLASLGPINVPQFQVTTVDSFGVDRRAILSGEGDGPLIIRLPAPSPTPEPTPAGMQEPASPDATEEGVVMPPDDVPTPTVGNPEMTAAPTSR